MSQACDTLRNSAPVVRERAHVPRRNGTDDSAEAAMAPLRPPAPPHAMHSLIAVAEGQTIRRSPPFVPSSEGWQGPPSASGRVRVARPRDYFFFLRLAYK